MEIVFDAYQLAGQLPEQGYGLCSQITRAAVSIPSNFADGSGFIKTLGES